MLAEGTITARIRATVDSTASARCSQSFAPAASAARPSYAFRTLAMPTGDPARIRQATARTAAVT